jgi:hypothetical protein
VLFSNNNLPRLVQYNRHHNKRISNTADEFTIRKTLSLFMSQMFSKILNFVTQTFVHWKPLNTFLQEIKVPKRVWQRKIQRMSELFGLRWKCNRSQELILPA